MIGKVTKFSEGRKIVEIPAKFRRKFRIGEQVVISKIPKKKDVKDADNKK